LTSELAAQAARLIEARGLQLDEAQARMLGCLGDWLQVRLRPPAWLRRPAAGAYLWGGVGRGKSLLLDALFQVAPLAKRRLHVHALLQDVQRRLLAHAGRADPLARVADELAAEARLLFVDEFHVHDIGDAILLGRLLQPLFEIGELPALAQCSLDVQQRLINFVDIAYDSGRELWLQSEHDLATLCANVAHGDFVRTRSRLAQLRVDGPERLAC